MRAKGMGHSVDIGFWILDAGFLHLVMVLVLERAEHPRDFRACSVRRTA